MLLNRHFLFATPSRKKTVTGVQVVNAFQVQSIGCRWHAGHFVLPITDWKNACFLNSAELCTYVV